MSEMPGQESIHEELKRFVSKRYKVERSVLDLDPSFEDIGADSLTRVEILLHGDDTFGSHVLDYMEDGLLDGDPPTRLSELAALIPVCVRSPMEVVAERKRAAAMPSHGSDSV